MILKIENCYRLFHNECLTNILSSGIRFDNRKYVERRQIFLAEDKDKNLHFSITLGHTKVNCHIQIELKDNNVIQSQDGNDISRLKIFVNDKSPLCNDSEFSIGHKRNLLNPLNAKEVILCFLRKEWPVIFSNAGLKKTESEKAFDNLITESGINEEIFSLNKDNNITRNSYVVFKFHFDIIENDGNVEKALFYGIKEMMLNGKVRNEIETYFINWDTEYILKLEMEKVSFIEEFILVDPSRMEEDTANNNMWLFFHDRGKVKFKIEKLLTLNELNFEKVIKQVKGEIFK